MSEKEPALYAVDSPPFVAHFRSTAKVNRRRIREWYHEPIRRIEALLDAYYAFACQHVWTFHLTRPNPTPIEKLLFSAVHKNHIALFAFLEMTQDGLFGPVRPLLRQVFEAQMLAKFAAISGDAETAQRWLAGESVAIGRTVFPRIKQPAARPLVDFWRILHSFVHASPSSQQVSLYAKDNKEGIGLDLMFLSLLMHNQAHLLTKHAFSQASRKYASRYSPPRTITNLRSEIRQLLAEDMPDFSQEGKALVRAFRAPWELSSGTRVA